MLKEGSIFCICFEASDTFVKFKEKANVRPLIVSIVYFVVPTILMAVAFYYSHIINVLLYWVSAGIYLFIHFKG